MSLSPEAMAAASRLGLDAADPDLIEQLVADLATDLEELTRLAVLYPLACRVLWRNDAAEWDQRRAVLAAMTADKITLVMGGYRSGKSDGLKQLTAAYAMGEGNPAVQAWLTVNELPFGIIPTLPSNVYAIAQSSGDSQRYHRPDFTALLPQGRWYNLEGKGEAHMHVPSLVGGRQGTIWFKSVDQKRRSFQGISIPWWWVDEEPLGEDGRGVIEELKARAADQRGKGAISMIPAEGITWVHKDYVVKRKDNVQIAELDSLNNPHNDPVGMRMLFEGMSEDDLAVARYGKFTSRSGKIYPYHDGIGDSSHTCEPFEIPPEWPRYRGADFGLVNPTCVVWGAEDPDGTMYIFREHYQAGLTYEQHGEIVKALSAGESYQGSWGDPSAAEVMETTWSAMDLVFDLANREVKNGIDRVRNLMRPRADGKPRFKVFSTCPNTIREVAGYVWDPSRVGEIPLKLNDHAPDAVRYLVAGREDLRGI